MSTLKKPSKVIITCAITDGIHTPTMSDALPLTPDQITEQSVAAAEAGAAILHLHARDPATGKPSPDPKLFMDFLPRIKKQSDAVLNVTTGGGLNMTVADRLAAPMIAQPEMCSLNMGSMNFAIFCWRTATRTGSMIGRRPICAALMTLFFATRSGTLSIS
jgi:uncharacterized protein (DUF849 family)